MLRFVFPLLVGLGLAGASAPASALTPIPLSKPAAESDVVKADYYCGPGWHLYRGRCVPNYYGYYNAPSFYWWYGPSYRHHRYHGYKNYGHHGGKSYKSHGGKGGKSFKHYGGKGGKSFKHGGGGGGGKHGHRGGHGGGRGKKG